MLIQIKSWYDNSIIFEADCETIAACVKLAIAAGKSLFRADLRSADLSFANLSFANLSFANLRFANLRSADLRSANLSFANLSFANLRSADLRSADLSLANLSSIRNDIWSILLFAPLEVSSLQSAMVEGRVNGSCYEGECCCLLGTLAHARGVDYKSLNGIVPDASRPAEAWFSNISEGDTPKNSEVVRLTLEWVDEWMRRIDAVYVPRVPVAVAD